VFGILAVVISAILLALSPAAATFEKLKAVALVGVVFGALLGHIYLSRIVVAEGYISSRVGLWPERLIEFAKIAYSKPKTLVEPDHPVMLDIFGVKNDARTSALLQIRLKAFRKADVQWLFSLPQLKVIAK
jgi:hypothetical protein